MTRMSDLRPIDCTACPIRHRAVCARCDAAELDQLAAIKTYRNFSAGAQIMQRGAPLEFVASVVTGVVSLSKTLEDGRIQTVGLLLASDFIGQNGLRLTLMSRPPRMWCCVAFSAQISRPCSTVPRICRTAYWK